MELRSKRKNGFGIFLHRHLHQLFGILLLTGITALGYVGWRQAHPKEFSLEEYMGFDKLRLSYEVTIDGFDGEMFTYSVYFDHTVTSADKNEIEAELAPLREDSTEDDYFGDIMLYDDGSTDKIMIVLDLGNADDDRMINGILTAIDGINGIERVVINEGAD